MIYGILLRKEDSTGGRATIEGHAELSERLRMIIMAASAGGPQDR